MFLFDEIASGDDVVDYIPRYIRQTVIAAAVTIGKLGMVDAQQIENGRVNVMHMHRFIDRFPAEIIRCAVSEALLDASAGKPHGEAMRVVIAPVVGLSAVETAAHLDDRRAAELGAGNDL
jgi:hypothetical protein